MVHTDKPLSIILGSSSPHRRSLLAEMGVRFSVMEPNFDESTIRNDDPKALTMALALAKAEALAPCITEPKVLITCDQVAVFKGQIRGKPNSAGQAMNWLLEYGGNVVHYVTSINVMLAGTNFEIMCRGTSMAELYVRKIPNKAIVRAIEKGLAMRVCSGLAIDDRSVSDYVTGFRCDGYTKDAISSIKGLPQQMTNDLLKRAYELISSAENLPN